MKSRLFLDGFSLYRQIWSDQPPLMTVALAYWFKMFAPTVYNGRILILLFSLVFLWAFYQTIQITEGHLTALIASGLLILSTAFSRQSVAIMDGPLFLTTAMLAIYCIRLFRKYRFRYPLILSGLFFALSLQAKLTSLFLLPVLIFEIIRPEGINQKQNKNPFKPGLLWLAVVLSVYLAITIISFYPDFNLITEQLFQPHFPKLVFSDMSEGLRLILKMLLGDYDIVILALISLTGIIRRKDIRFYLPVLWLCLFSLIFLIYKPLWYHYYLFISIPLCWLAAAGATNFFYVDLRNPKQFLPHKKPLRTDTILRCTTAVMIILTVFRIPGKYDRVCKSLWGETTAKEKAVIDNLCKYKKQTRWLFTDQPIFAFYSGIPVVPELAVVSPKRIAVLMQNNPPQSFIYLLEKYKPEQLLFTAFFNQIADLDSRVSSYIKDNYSKVYTTDLTKKIIWSPADSGSYPVYTWIPIGHYLPKCIKFTGNSRLNDIVWRWKIPVPGKRFFTDGYRPLAYTNIYVRKEIIKSTPIKAKN